MSVDQRNAHWAARRRPVRSGEAVVLPPSGPRFPRFAAAMAAARAAHVPHVAPDDEPLADDLAPTLDEPDFAFDHDAPAYDVAPTLSHDSPRPRAAQWRAVRPPRRPVARWLGVGSCVLLVGLVALTMLTEPISAEIERLIRPWVEWQPGREAAAPQPRPATPAPAAARDRPPSEPQPVLARDEPAAAPADGSAAAVPDDEPPVRTGVPLPSLKPSPDDQ